MQTSWGFRFAGICLLCLIMCFVSNRSYAQTLDVIDTFETRDISLIKGDLLTLKVHSLTRLSISDPSIADVVSADADELLIIGNSIGHCMYFIWDEHGKRTLFIRVVQDDLPLVKTRIEKLIETAGIHEKDLVIDINNYEGKVVISGKVVTDNLDRITDIVQPFGGNVYLILQQKDEELIQIDMQISELNTTLLHSLGFKWTSGASDSISLVYSETLTPDASFDDQLDRLIKTGQFNRTTALLATIEALVDEGKARVLSKPSIIVANGKEANFQVGGQIPIRTTTTGASGTAQESVSFKDFGILITVQPTLIANDKIAIALTVEDSDVDASLPAATDVGFSTRSAQTELILDDQQPIVIAGLIKTNRSETVSKIPFLGDIPIVGAFFRHRSNVAADKDTELVISLKPTIVRSAEDEDEEETVAAEDAEGETELAKADIEDDFVGESKKEMLAESEDFEDEEVYGEIEMEREDDVALEVEDEVEEDGLEGVEEIVSADGGKRTGKEWEPSETDFSADSFLGSMGISGDLAEYVQTVQGRISQAISYPFEAVEKGWEGTVKIKIKILKDGTLDEAYIKESSGYAIFDKDALNTALILAPFSAFPPDLDLDEIIVTVPIVYSQDSVAIELAACHLDITNEGADGIQPFVLSGKTYAEMVQEKIAQLALYPDGAERYGWEGTVKLKLRILKDGTLERASVKESSGYKVFDECALQTAKAVAPYSVFPAESDLQALNVTIPLVYSLESN